MRGQTLLPVLLLFWNLDKLHVHAVAVPSSPAWWSGNAPLIAPYRYPAPRRPSRSSPTDQKPCTDQGKGGKDAL